MRDDRERLRDILEAIVRIEKHTVRGRTVFEQDELIQTWVVHLVRKPSARAPCVFQCEQWPPKCPAIAPDHLS